MLGGVTVGIWSGYPSFRKSCHHIRPHCESWATSLHGKEEITCTDCHFEPGMLPYVMGKVNGLVEVVKYGSLTRTEAVCRKDVQTRAPART